MISRLRRREFLRALGYAAGATPLVQAYARQAYAAESGHSGVRLLLAANLNGRGRDGWQTTGTETDFKLSYIHEPLEKHRKKILIVEGVNNEAARTSAGNPHRKGLGTLMTGFRTSGGDGAEVHGGPSVDQVIAAKVGQQTPFASLQFGVPPTKSSIAGVLSTAGPGKLLLPQTNPLQMFNRVFAGLKTENNTGPTTEQLRVQAEKKSILDLIRGQLQDLERATGAAFQQHVDAHLETVRAIEKRLLGSATMTRSCTKPSEPKSGSSHAEVSRNQLALIAAAFACNLTRVATLLYSHATNTVRYDWIGAGSDDGHSLSHEPDSNMKAWDQIKKIERWHMGEMAYLLDQLDAFPSLAGNGTLLDDCAVLWTSDCGKGNDHSYRPVPVVLAGSAGGFLKPGRYVHVGVANHNQLLTSLAHAMGVTVPTVGDPAFGKGRLPFIDGVPGLADIGI